MSLETVLNAYLTVQLGLQFQHFSKFRIRRTRVVNVATQSLYLRKKEPPVLIV
jgi:hypothetical protein